MALRHMVLARYIISRNTKTMRSGMGVQQGYVVHPWLEIQEQAEMRKRSMMAAIRKDPANRVSEKDKALDPMAWAGRMNNFQVRVHEVIYSDLICN